MLYKGFFKIFVMVFAIIALAPNCRAQGTKAVGYKAKVTATFPHYEKAYTQGLFFYKGRLYESSGQYGQSFFHEVDLAKGSTLRSFNLAPKFFAEGAVVLNDKLYILTWMEMEVLVYDINTLRQVGKLFNRREGWGLTTDGRSLISTDGSSNIFFHDPATFADQSRIEVTLNGKPLSQLNELEYINGEIWANVYGTDMIVIINPVTGIVRATVDCTGLLPLRLRKPDTDVLNGIAYDPENRHIYVTGKYWPRMFRIELEKL